MIYILSMMLIAGFLFVYIPFEKKEFITKNLKISGNKTQNIQNLILFVSDRREGETLDATLGYKVLLQMSRNQKNTKCIWLLHSPIESGEYSSYATANQLYQRFHVGRMDIKAQLIKDIYNPEESYRITETILQENKHLLPNKLVCDCTAGTKTVTLGIALAAMDKAKMIYFAKDHPKDSSSYKEIVISKSSIPIVSDS